MFALIKDAPVNSITLAADADRLGVQVRPAELHDKLSPKICEALGSRNVRDVAKELFAIGGRDVKEEEFSEYIPGRIEQGTFDGLGARLQWFRKGPLYTLIPEGPHHNEFLIVKVSRAS